MIIHISIDSKSSEYEIQGRSMSDPTFISKNEMIWV